MHYIALSILFVILLNNWIKLKNYFLIDLNKIFKSLYTLLQEIADNPQLFVEGFSRFDVQQGELGDCWLLAAVANLTMDVNLFFQVVPEDQSFEENYAGIFHFRYFYD